MAQNYEKSAATFVAVLFHSATNAHFMHLRTTSYAQHKALEEYYEGIVDLVDKWAEAYQGAYDQIDKYPSDFHLATDPIAYIRKIKDFVDAARETLPDDTPLQNIVDEIVDLIDSTSYKLRFLK
jgi:DNA-binding ferritin-like protein